MTFNFQCRCLLATVRAAPYQGHMALIQHPCFHSMIIINLVLQGYCSVDDAITSVCEVTL